MCDIEDEMREWVHAQGEPEFTPEEMEELRRSLQDIPFADFTLPGEDDGPAGDFLEDHYSQYNSDEPADDR